MAECIVCGDDDGIYLLCGKHWSEYVWWDRRQDEQDQREDDDNARA